MCFWEIQWFTTQKNSLLFIHVDKLPHLQYTHGFQRRTTKMIESSSPSRNQHNCSLWYQITDDNLLVFQNKVCVVFTNYLRFTLLILHDFLCLFLDKFSNNTAIFHPWRWILSILSILYLDISLMAEISSSHRTFSRAEFCLNIDFVLQSFGLVTNHM